MSVDFLKKILIFIVLCILQALVFNKVHLFGYATPMLYVYFILLFRVDAPKWITLLWAFFMGVVIDMFANTQGMTSASLTLTAFIQPYLLTLFIRQDKEEQLVPSLRDMEFGKFVTYALILILIHCTVYFTIEQFAFFDPVRWAICIGASTLFTLLMILLIEIVRG